jgi:hypothetical protein
VAARAAFPEYLGANGRFVVMGRSQDDAVSWAFAERQARTPVPGYLGTVTLAPLTDAIGMAAAVQAGLAANGKPTLPSTRAVLGIQNKVVTGVTAVCPAYNDRGLTDLSRDRLRNVLAKLQGCLPTDILTFADVLPNQTAKADWTNDLTVHEFQSRARVGRKSFAGTLLMLAAELDPAVPFPFVDEAVNRACETRVEPRRDGYDDLEMVTFLGVDHFPLIQASQSLWMDWIKIRLCVVGNGDAGPGCRAKRDTGGSGKAKCRKRTVAGFRSESTAKSGLPNWLVSWVDPNTGFWQLFLQRTASRGCELSAPL